MDNTIVEITNPIMPTMLVDWYNTSGWSILSAANPILSWENVMNTCSNKSECVHDLIIRVNPITSAVTGQSLQSFQTSREILGKHLKQWSFVIKISIHYSRRPTSHYC